MSIHISSGLEQFCAELKWR